MVEKNKKKKEMKLKSSLIDGAKKIPGENPHSCWRENLLFMVLTVILTASANLEFDPMIFYRKIGDIIMKGRQRESALFFRFLLVSIGFQYFFINCYLRPENCQGAERINFLPAVF